jgi:hypothetical protein
MNLRNALRLARIFSLSASRANRAEGGTPQGLAKRPVTNLVASPFAFALSAIFTCLVLGPKMDAFILQVLALQFSVFMPAFTMFMSIVYSLMTEFSKPGEATSTDIVNWLPIQAGDFVAGSVLTTLYFVAPIAFLFLGFAFGLSFQAGSLSVWTLGAAVSVLGCILGALALEIARGALNRASGAFSGVGGQSAVILRMVLSVAIIVAVSMMFNFSMMMRFVAWFSTGLAGIRFVPILWPSMIVLEQASGNISGALFYSGLSALLLTAVYFASVRVRELYWAPAPVSLKMKPVKISRSRGLLGALGFDSGEAAVIRKDLKSLLRRREMVAILAIPVMVLLMGFMGTPIDVLMNPSAHLEAKSTFLFQCALAVLVLELQLSLNVVGQEREEFMNILSAPIDAGRLLKAKAASAFIPALPVLALLSALISLLTSIDAATMIALTLLGGTLLAAVTSVELAVGARYAIFTSGGRDRFVTQEGTIIGMLLGMATIGVSLSPLTLHYWLEYVGVVLAFALTFAMTLAITWIGLRVARGELEKLYGYSY